MHKIPYYTTVAGARAVVQAMTAPAARDLAVAPLQSYYRTLCFHSSQAPHGCFSARAPDAMA